MNALPARGTSRDVFISARQAHLAGAEPPRTCAPDPGGRVSFPLPGTVGLEMDSGQLFERGFSCTLDTAGTLK